MKLNLSSRLNSRTGMIDEGTVRKGVVKKLWMDRLLPLKYSGTCTR